MFVTGTTQLRDMPNILSEMKDATEYLEESGELCLNRRNLSHLQRFTKHQLEALGHIEKERISLSLLGKTRTKEKNPKIAKREIDKWVEKLNPKDPRYRNHQLEAIWAYRNLDLSNIPLRELLYSDNHYARAAAAKQLRYWHGNTKDGNKLLEQAAKDPNGLVRMEAAIACSYIGTKEAFNILKQMNELPNEKHLNYAIITALGSHKMRNFGIQKQLR